MLEKVLQQKTLNIGVLICRKKRERVWTGRCQKIEKGARRRLDPMRELLIRNPVEVQVRREHKKKTKETFLTKNYSTNLNCVSKH